MEPAGDQLRDREEGGCGVTGDGHAPPCAVWRKADVVGGNRGKDRGEAVEPDVDTEQLPPPPLDRDKQSVTPDDLSQRAFYPMTMPLTVGPGSISVALTLGANPPPGFRSLLLTALAHGVGILLVAVGVYFCYRYADRILRKLGPTGTSVVVRLTAFILLCIGVQICWNGVHGLIATGFPSSVS